MFPAPHTERTNCHMCTSSAGLPPELSQTELPVVALVGMPNVGKSTVFNALTGMHQHTGNWAGKTVASAVGTVTWNGESLLLADLPGTYCSVPAVPRRSWHGIFSALQSRMPR